MEIKNINKEQIDIIQDCFIEKLVIKQKALEYWSNIKPDGRLTQAEINLIKLEINQTIDLLNEVIQQCRIQKAING